MDVTNQPDAPTAPDPAAGPAGSAFLVDAPATPAPGGSLPLPPDPPVRPVPGPEGRRLPLAAAGLVAVLAVLCLLLRRRHRP